MDRYTGVAILFSDIESNGHLCLIVHKKSCLISSQSLSEKLVLLSNPEKLVRVEWINRRDMTNAEISDVNPQINKQTKIFFLRFIFLLYANGCYLRSNGKYFQCEKCINLKLAFRVIFCFKRIQHYIHK